jgi:predicted metal-dependent HD superfamily phosphohydrolase
MNWPGIDQWEALMQAAGAAGTEAKWYDLLTKAYAEPQRYYHNRQHIAECLEEFNQVRHLAKQPAAVELALWFHDAVYDPKAGDNEERSAELAAKCLQESRVAPALIAMVVQLIMATKKHETGDDLDAKIMVDVDLSILGRDEKRFFEYEEQIRQEYAWVPPEVFGPKRAEILEHFLVRENIFRTDRFRQKYEERARKNLAASIQKLKHMP